MFSSRPCSAKDRRRETGLEPSQRCALAVWCWRVLSAIVRSPMSYAKPQWTSRSPWGSGRTKRRIRGERGRKPQDGLPVEPVKPSPSARVVSAIDAFRWSIGAQKTDPVTSVENRNHTRSWVWWSGWRSSSGQARFWFSREVSAGLERRGLIKEHGGNTRLRGLYESADRP